jgi:hypothetical protein
MPGFFHGKYFDAAPISFIRVFSLALLRQSIGFACTTQRIEP